jgi:hypothetical protein
MMTERKYILAREWFIFTGCFIVGFAVLPLSWVLLFAGARNINITKIYGELLVGLLEGEFILWILILSPYIFLQFIRSVLWAYRVFAST